MAQRVEQNIRDVEDAIRRVEAEIDSQKERFERLRQDMITGITSHGGVTASAALERLTGILQDLQRQRADAILQARKLYMDEAMPPPKRVKVDIADCCKDPNNIRQDNMVDVCTVCSRTFDRRLDNTTANTSFADFHPGEYVCRTGGYKPPNHFAEIISQFQGKRRSHAPADIVESVAMLCKQHFIEAHRITPDVVRMFLKQMQQEQSIPEVQQAPQPAQVQENHRLLPALSGDREPAKWHPASMDDADAGGARDAALCLGRPCLQNVAALHLDEGQHKGAQNTRGAEQHELPVRLLQVVPVAWLRMFFALYIAAEIHSQHRRQRRAGLETRVQGQWLGLYVHTLIVPPSATGPLGLTSVRVLTRRRRHTIRWRHNHGVIF